MPIVCSEKETSLLVITKKEVSICVCNKSNAEALNVDDSQASVTYCNPPVRDDQNPAAVVSADAPLFVVGVRRQKSKLE
jgi:hypothetical protein